MGVYSFEDGLRASWYFNQFIKDRGSFKAPWNVAFNTPLKSWEYYQLPGNESLAKRLEAVLKGQIDHLPKEIVTQGYNWSSLKDGSTIVDVGGSVGVSTHCILKEHPNLKYIVQDLPNQIDAGKGWWAQNEPEAIKSGQVV